MIQRLGGITQVIVTRLKTKYENKNPRGMNPFEIGTDFYVLKSSVFIMTNGY